MTIRKMLEKIIGLEALIQEEEEEIEKLRTKAEAIGGTGLDEPRVVKSAKRGAKFESYVDVLYDSIRLHEENVIELQKLENEATVVFRKIDDPTNRRIMMMRYVKGMKLQEIATKMNYSIGAISYRRNKAITELEKKFENI